MRSDESAPTRPAVRFLRDGEGRRIAWAAHGEGPVVVCPAWWVSHLEHDWDDPAFRRFFDAFAARHRVVRYDRAGVGLSDRGDARSDLDREVDTLRRVLDAAGAERAHLLGVSMGGPVAVAFAARQPHRVGRLVLAGSFLHGEDTAAPEVAAALVALVRAHWGLGSRALGDVFLPGAPPDVFARSLTRQRVACSGAVAADVLELAYRLDARADAPHVEAATHVVHRRGDRAMPVEAGRRLAAAIPGASFVTLDGALHPPWEGPGDVLECALAFLEGGAIEAPAAPRCRLDEDARALVVDGATVPLTPTELALLGHLRTHRGRVVPRDELLAEVWRQHAAGSNVVDAAVRGLRRKLGRYAPSVATVVGHGYRFDGFVARDT